ncbi:hypothetical protein LOK49_LG06G00847 [Camellia lanceoleosa]|uniref:Uncharacterized protein n=1 Tax=Camellia lanceoleosa TaxID=1840588 RepID=A0ACC0HA22_9ERIC|nr:hypothetical protein LOK49_LG06G00847 [Camellia lanceoleosa]
MQYGNFKNNKIARIIGLGWGPDSFVDDIGSQSDGKFSYCLLVVNLMTVFFRPGSYLRFGVAGVDEVADAQRNEELNCGVSIGDRMDDGSYPSIVMEIANPCVGTTMAAAIVKNSVVEDRPLVIQNSNDDIEA